MTDARDLPPCHSLWIGPRLGRVGRACLRSVLRQGHPMTLWCYGPPEDVPEGVALRDAAELLPATDVLRHRSGSPALFANRFRYELQRRGLGIWLDCDIYLVRPLDDLPDHLLGWESPERINNAVLRLPTLSPLLAPLLAVFDERDVPLWLPARARLAATWRLSRTGRTGLARMPWGVAGPSALTWLAQKHGLAVDAQPEEVFYPVHWSRAGWIRDPAITLEDIATPRTRAVHLWNQVIAPWKEADAPAGTFLARLQAEGA
jgi:hypothetical protein